MKICELDKAYSANIFSPLNFTLVKGEGSTLWDDDGREYIDFMSGYGALVLGHCHSALVKAAQQQLNTLTMTSRAVYNNVTSKFISELCVFTGFSKAILMNSGAEAVETAIKLARLWGYKSGRTHKNQGKIIVFDGNFHGRTSTIVGFSSEKKYQDGFGPFDGGFLKVPYNDIDAFEQTLETFKETVCAVLIEPIQGEAGIIIPDDDYLLNIKHACEKHEILLIADEIQCGLGRTGKMFAYEHSNIKPDLLILGKGLGGGIVPISAVVGTDNVMGRIEPGMHGSTFGGNPLACAIASEVLYQLRTTDVVQRSKIEGDAFRHCLEATIKTHDPGTFKPRPVTAIRQIGLWIAIDIDERSITAKEMAWMLACNGVLCRETHGKTLRIAPALNISDKELSKGITTLVKTLNGDK